MSPTEKITVACIQMCSGIQVSENLETLCTRVNEAATAGAVYVQTPEMSLVLDDDRHRLLSDRVQESQRRGLQRLARLAADLRLWLHVGSCAIRCEKDPSRAANRAHLFDPQGRTAATYDKIHLFDVDLQEGETHRESHAYSAGAFARVVQAGPLNLGLSICYDLRFPGLYRALAHQGAEVMAIPSAFTCPTGQAHWRTLLRARAIENGAFVIAAAQGGKHPCNRKTYGHSMIVSPWGRVVAGLEHDDPGVLIASIDLAEISHARKQIPSLRHDRPFDVKGIKVPPPRS